MSTDSPFKRHCVEGVRSFVQTAVVIDNEHYYPAQGRASEPPLQATRVSGSILERSGAERGAEDATEPAIRFSDSPIVDQASTQNKDDHAETEGAIDNDALNDEGPSASPSSHQLNAKEIADAFHLRKIICGLYKPEASEGMVELAVAAAENSDVVILDWYLENGSSAKAKEIVKGILQQDRAQNGRLRLIAVYTAEQGLQDICAELDEAIQSDQNLKNRVQRVKGDLALVGRDTRICFLNKITAIGASDVNKVSVSDLPDRVLSEFSRITTGILPTFALRSIAAIRRAAHHLITVFRREFDGAYVGHRCGIKEPDDAVDFATEMLISRLRNSISMEAVPEQCLSAEVLRHWVDSLEASGHTFGASLSPALDAASVKKVVEGGKTHLDNVNGERVDKVGSGRIGAVFYTGQADSDSAHSELARLSSFKRESSGSTRFPSPWTPRLTLGTVIKALPFENGSTSDEIEAGRYYICLQPRCDSVRLAEETAFPFQVGMESQNKFNLVVGGDTGESVNLLVKTKPCDTVMIRFAPSARERVVKAVRRPENYFVFEDKHGRKYRWIGDLHDLKAQRGASELAARVHTVGIDDLEWLRQKADKVKDRD